MPFAEEQEEEGREPPGKLEQLYTCAMRLPLNRAQFCEVRGQVINRERAARATKFNLPRSLLPV